MYLLAQAAVFYSSGLSAWVYRQLQHHIPYAWLAAAAYLAAAFLFYSLLEFPLSFYGSYVTEREFGLSSQGALSWLKDHLKASCLSMALMVLAFAVLYRVIARFPGGWWWISALLWVFFSLVLARLVPVMIIPLFFKYKPVSDEDLKARIISLAQRMKIAIKGVFEIDLSRKTSKGNAAVVGLGSSRRVLLADTLNGRYTNDEIEVILAHEFAHYRSGDLMKMVLLNSLSTLAIFFLIFKSQALFIRHFGIDPLADISGFPLFVILLVLLGVMTQPFLNLASRAIERRADAQALAATGFKQQFISVMEKLAEQNLVDRSPGPFARIFFFDHPPIDERIASAKSE